MNRHPRQVSADQGKDAWIGHDDRVGGGGRHNIDKPLQGLQVTVARVDIDGQVDPDPPVVGIADSLSKFFVGEIFRLAAEAKILAGQIDRVGSVMDGDLQLLEIAGRGEKLDVRRIFIHGAAGSRSGERVARG